LGRLPQKRAENSINLVRSEVSEYPEQFVFFERMKFTRDLGQSSRTCSVLFADWTYRSVYPKFSGN
jgi:hypothetical protein